MKVVIILFLLFFHLLAIDDEAVSVNKAQILKDFGAKKIDSYLTDPAQFATRETLIKEKILSANVSLVNNISAAQFQAQAPLESLKCPTLEGDFVSKIYDFDDNAQKLTCVVLKKDGLRKPLYKFTVEYPNIASAFTISEQKAAEDMSSAVATSKATYANLQENINLISQAQNGNDEVYLNTFQVLLAVFLTDDEKIDTTASRLDNRIVVRAPYTSFFIQQNGKRFDSTEVFGEISINFF